MKKSIFVILIMCIFLMSCSPITKDVFEVQTIGDKYNLSDGYDYELGEDLLLKYTKFENTNGYLLTYPNSIFYEEEQKMSSFSKNGKYYISIDSYFLSVEDDVSLNQDILSGVIEKVYLNVTKDYGEGLKEHLDYSNPYIISGNNNCYYIDYLTAFNKESNILVYYHILVEDKIEVENIRKVDYDKLSDNLQVLRECLGVYDEFDYPKL